MSTGFESIDHTVQQTHLWVNELDEILGWDDKPRSYRLLRAVLQTLRDWLPVNEAADLGAQLPTLLRGVYYEHWRPATTPVKPRTLDDFLMRIDEAFRNDRLNVLPDAVSCVFDLLAAKISAGEIADVRHALPADLRELWPTPHRAA
jgi:uncharacterized protein (DUF2267 family)